MRTINAKPRRNGIIVEENAHTRKTVADAIGALDHSIADFQTNVETGIRPWKFEDNCADNAMQLLLGNRGSTDQLLLSSKRVRRYAGESLIYLLDSEQRKSARSHPGRTWWFLTFLADGGFINTYRPEIDVPAFKKRVDALVRSSGLNAVCALELQALTNYPLKGLGRTLMLNGHAIGYTDEPFDAVAVEKRLRASPRLQHSWGLPTVEIKQIGVSGEPVAWLAYYLLKAPHIAKYREWNPAARPPGYRLKDTSMRSDVAVRLVELLSQLTFNEMVWGVGGGAAIVGQWRRELLGWAASYRPPTSRLEAEFDVAKLWRDTRALNSHRRLQPVRFIDRGDPPFGKPPATPTAPRRRRKVASELDWLNDQSGQSQRDGPPVEPPSSSSTSALSRLHAMFGHEPPSPELDDL